MSICRQFYYSLVHNNRNHFSNLITNKRQILSQLNEWQTMSSFQFSSVDELKVEHNLNRHEFYIKLGKGFNLIKFVIN
jgi:hypothetical protein